MRPLRFDIIFFSQPLFTPSSSFVGSGLLGVCRGSSVAFISNDTLDLLSREPIQVIVVSLSSLR